MANKGMKNLFGNLFGGKAAQEEKAKKGPESVSAPRAREKEMIALLEGIDLADPQNKLSQEKLQELNVEGVIRYALSELRYPFITEHDTKNLDANMKKIIALLKEAVREGHEMTAEWACTALVFAIKSLRVDIPEVDEDNSETLMKCRVQYSENLRLLVELCREHDVLSSNLADQRERRQKKREELDLAKSHYQSRRDSGALDLLLGELQTKIHAPATMSDEALALRDELNHIQHLKASLLQIDTDINAQQLTLNNRKAQIDSSRNILATPPHAEDPKLQERINETNRLYREALRSELNNAEKAMRDFNVHISAMTELANHSAFVMSVSESLEIVKQMELEKYQQLQAENEAAAVRNRNAQNHILVQEALQNQLEEQEQILEEHRNTITVDEPVIETEPVVNIEYDFD